MLIAIQDGLPSMIFAVKIKRKISDSEVYFLEEVSSLNTSYILSKFQTSYMHQTMQGNLPSMVFLSHQVHTTFLNSN